MKRRFRSLGGRALAALVVVVPGAALAAGCFPAPPAAYVADAIALEGAGSLSFTVTLSVTSTSTVTVGFATADGSAVAPGDYRATSGTVSFAPGERTKTVAVPLAADALDEAPETLTLTLNAPTGATIGDGSARGTIADDDPAAGISIGDAGPSVNETGTLTFPVRLSTASGQEASVSYATQDGTAHASKDYGPTSGRLVFTPGTTELTVTVPLLGDPIDEWVGPEQFSVVLSDPRNVTFLDGLGMGTITDDDATPTITVDDVRQVEGNPTDPAQSLITFRTRLSHPSSSGIVLYFSATDGSAKLGDDVSELGWGANFGFNAGVTESTYRFTVNRHLVRVRRRAVHHRPLPRRRRQRTRHHPVGGGGHGHDRGRR